MVYPREFSAKIRTRIELEETLASQEFNQLQKDLPWSSHEPGPELEQLIRKYVLRVWKAFVEEACELGRQRIWDLGRVKTESLEFLGQLTSKAYLEKGFDSGGRAYPGQLRCLPAMTSHVTGTILPEVMRQYQMSAEWQRYLELLVGVGEAWAVEPDKPVVTVPRQTDETGASEVVRRADRFVNTGTTTDQKLRAERRSAVVEPILQKKGWSLSRLATEANVGKARVYDYLAGKRDLSAQSRKSIAKALRLDPQKLPK